MPNLKEFEHPTIAGFWAFCQERESIRKRKESGMSSPWTEDIILSMYFFCNVRREDDRGTRWYMEHVATSDIRGKLDRELLWRTILYRAVNSVKWFRDMGGVFGEVEWATDQEHLRFVINSMNPPSNPAYIVLQGPDGKNRKEHLFELLAYLEENIDALTISIN